jgi:hypothetical protein
MNENKEVLQLEIKACKSAAAELVTKANDARYSKQTTL